MIWNEIIHNRLLVTSTCLACVGLSLTGCGGGSDQQTSTDRKPRAKAATEPEPAAGSKSKQPGRKFAAVTLGGDSESTGGGRGSESTSSDNAMVSVGLAMEPVQIMVGKW